MHMNHVDLLPQLRLDFLSLKSAMICITGKPFGTTCTNHGTLVSSCAEWQMQSRLLIRSCLKVYQGMLVSEQTCRYEDSETSTRPIDRL